MPEHGGLFWVSKRGARIALIGLHVAALIAVLIELVLPFPAGGKAIKRVEELDFLASYALWGLGSCVVLVLLGLVLRRLIMRDEDYYEQRP